MKMTLASLALIPFVFAVGCGSNEPELTPLQKLAANYQSQIEVTLGAKPSVCLEKVSPNRCFDDMSDVMLGISTDVKEIPDGPEKDALMDPLNRFADASLKFVINQCDGGSGGVVICSTQQVVMDRALVDTWSVFDDHKAQ